MRRELEMKKNFFIIDEVVEMGCWDGKSSRNKISVMDAERRIDLFARNFAKTGAARLRACAEKIRVPKGFLYDLISLLSRPRPVHSRVPRLLDSWLLATACCGRILESVAHITELCLRLWCKKYPLSRYYRSSKLPSEIIFFKKKKWLIKIISSKENVERIRRNTLIQLRSM